MLENTRKYALFFINFKSTTENETIQTRKTTNFTFWHSGCCFFTFLSLTACIVHEYLMLENTFWKILRTRTKLTER